MNSNRKYLIGLCVATLSLGALAQNADEHKDHHPAGTKPVATAVQKPSSGPVGADKMVAVDQHMKIMQTMHEKLLAAKTPEERQALMAEHMKLMQDGMAMMKQMGGMSAGMAKNSKMTDRQQMMEKRMDMMESMMQMMMDRMPVQNK